MSNTRKILEALTVLVEVDIANLAAALDSVKILDALAVLSKVDITDLVPALDSLDTNVSEDHCYELGLDQYARDRVRIAVGLLQAADDEILFWAEALRMSCPPEVRELGVQPFGVRRP